MKNRFFLIIVIFFTISLKAQNPQLSILKNNWTNYLLAQETNQDMVPFFFNQNPNGTWKDLDYTNQQRGNWPLRAHILRTVEMAQAYQQKGNKYYQNKQLSKNILLAYNWWVKNDLVNANWWYPQIGIPQSIGLIMLLMQTEIDDEHWQKGMDIMDRVEFGNLTGQNLVWVSSNIVLRSILKNDSSFVSEATEKIRNEMQFANNSEGLQPDYSFHQHGRQLQFGNYGLHFLEDQVKWMFILKDSQFDYTPEQIELMRNYFAEGQRWVIWKDVYDISSCGRQLFPNEQFKKYKRVHKSASEMKTIDPSHNKLYQSICGENELIGYKHFPYSELMVQRTNHFFVSIRMASNRIQGSESGNGENLSGYYLADGAMFLMKTGKEYFNIFPYFDWRKIPGTTAVQGTAKLPELGWKSYHIKSDFVGGLTTDACAITSMQYNRDSVVAQKSYFLFPEFTVCLGAGISGQKSQHLQTTIEQCFSTTPIYLKNGKIVNTDHPNSNKTIQARSLWHQGTGYIINQGKNLIIDSQMKSANWSKVIAWIDQKEEPKSVFTLGIDHGENVQNENYAYAVFPNIDKKDLAKIDKKQPYQLLSNTEAIQAVQCNEYTSIVFHQPGTLKINENIEVNSNVPAILLCEEKQNQLSIYICDPTQKLETARVTITNNKKSNNETFVNEILFPKGIEKGQPTHFEQNLVSKK